MASRELYIGLMSGTSLDAIDAVLMDFTDSVKMLGSVGIPLESRLREEIRALNSTQPDELARSLRLGKELACHFTEATLALLDTTQTRKHDVIAIGSHGQTLRHSPSGKLGYSLQVGDPSTLAELTGITVVADFRNRDIAAGGQGAPLVPAFHQAIFSAPDQNRAIINIGGMANVTLLKKGGAVLGFDTGPGNVLMNHWIKQHQQLEFDRNGDWAASGHVLDNVLKRMLEEQFFQLPPPKSTGRETFDLHWLEGFEPGQYHPADIQATLLEVTARSICTALPPDIDSIHVCGGGAHNQHLMQRLAALSGKPVATTEALGISPDWVEAAAFAWLARQTMNHKAGNLPSATGAKGPRVLGGIYPAR